jgi:NADH dehydrogenase
MAENHLVQVRELFQIYDSNADDSLSMNELMQLLKELGNKITALPPVRLPHPLPLNKS